MVLDITLRRICKKLYKRKSGLLLMQSGEERTRLVLDMIQSRPRDVDVVIWIAPAAYLARKNYIRDIKRSRRGVTGKFYFFSVEGISVSDYKYLKLYHLIDKYRAFAVLDEGLTIKNTESGRTARLISLARKFKYRVVLSETPLTQGLIDLYSQLQFINPSALKMTETQFSNIFLPYYTDMYPIRRRWSTPAEEKKLVRMLRPYIFLYDLKDKFSISYRDFFFDLSAKEQDSYLREKENYLNNKYRVGFLEIMQKFQHIYTLAKDKVEFFSKVSEEIMARKEKVIVYVKFLDEIQLLRECGVLKGLNYIVLSSDCKRKEIVLQFKEKCDILFCTYGAGGYSLNLNFCNNIVFFSQTFDYKNKLQSLYSLCSGGQDKEINVYNFWVNTGLEHLIKESLDRKENVLKNVCKNFGKAKAINL